MNRPHKRLLSLLGGGILVILLIGLSFAAILTRIHTASADANAAPWWKGATCDSVNNPGSVPDTRAFKIPGYPETTAFQSVWNGYETCTGGSIGYKPPNQYQTNFGGKSGYSIGEWQCVELAFRYMYLSLKVQVYKANGNQVVGNYKSIYGGNLEQVWNNNSQHQGPKTGDVISFAATTKNAAGHVAIVADASHIDETTGNGYIFLFEQNAGALGTNPSLHVTNWVVDTPPSSYGIGTVIGWLHPETQIATNNAGHVMLVTQQSLVKEVNLNTLPTRCNGPSDGAGHAVIKPGQHVVVISNTGIWSKGIIYYDIAYPDPCNGGDFSDDSLISLAEQNASVNAAVGFVPSSALSEVSSVHPATSSAVWRDCWGPNQCSDLHTSLPTLTLPSADGDVLYAWWTGSIWDPHWFHVLDPNHQGAAVYGRDWSVAPVCSQTSTNALISPLDTCSNPTPTSTPPSAPTPTPTSTSVPSSDGSQWISNSSPVTVSPGEQFSVQFTFQNTGQNTTWSDSAGYALQCDTYYHPNNNDCMGEQSVGFGGQSVSPGQQFTFTLNLTAPSSPGTYQTWWDMRHHGSIFGDNHANVQVMVQGSNPVPPPPTSPPAYDDAEFIGQSTWPTEPAGAQFSIYFVMQNTGNTTWTDGGGYYLACTSLCLGAPNTVGFNGQSIVPNQQYQFNITMWAPTTPGTYRTDWILEHNGTMFGPDLYIYVVVPVLKEQSPVCNDPSGTNWSSPNSSAVTSSCPGNGLLMQQVSSTKYAEFDLTQADEGSYNQTNFQVQVQASFQNTGDCSTWASIIFQTPTNSPGGYIFGVTPCGQWRLQQVITGTDIPTVSSGSISFNASQPVTITVNVQNDTLTASINNQQALTYSVGSPSGTLEVGLMVQRDHAEPSSEVLFSNFELDE